MERDEAKRAVTDAILASVALVARQQDEVDVSPQVLLEGTDPDLVCQVLAAICGAVMSVTLADGGRQVLVRISRNAVLDGKAGQ